MQKFKRTLLNFKWRIRWSQPDCSSCPNTPLKIAIGNKLTPTKIYQILLFETRLNFLCIMILEVIKMDKFLLYIIAGFAGGIIRGLVGFVKNKVIEKADHFKPQYFMVTILISGIVGAAAGALADTEWQVSFLAGYAGTDFIESLYKIKIGQKIGKI